MTSEPTPLHGLYVEGVNVAGMPVKCSGCGGKFHELTDRFRSEPPMRGTYLRMIARYRSWGWYAFPESDWVLGDNVQCPQCGTPYSTESVMRQIRAQVDEALGRVSEPVLLSSLPVDPPEIPVEIQMPEQATLFPELSDLDKEFEECAAPGNDSIYTPAGEDPHNIGMTVMRMTADGCTQTDIAKTCNLSVYMVRQIQNGKKV